MRFIVIRNSDSRFYKGPGKWVDAEIDARDFGYVSDGLEVCAKFPKGQLVVRMASTTPLPIQFAAEPVILITPCLLMDQSNSSTQLRVLMPLPKRAKVRSPFSTHRPSGGG